MTWFIIWHDTDKVVEQRQIGTNDDGAVYEQRITWSNPAAVDYQAEPLTLTTDEPAQ